MMIVLAATLFWSSKLQVWFWLTLAAIVLLHVPIILLIQWPLKQLSYVALLPAGLLDFAIAYGTISLVQRQMQKPTR